MDGNKRRIAVFVEGQTEQIFVRECLLKYYEYDASQLGIRCYRLLNHEMQPASHDHGDEHSQNLYMIIDSGNDNNVLGAIRRRYERLQNKYDSIIGLRDMFCDAYKSQAMGMGIDQELNQRFINSADKAVREFDCVCKVRFFFAIMEIEAWLIALCTPSLIGDIDPETEYLHPTISLKKILQAKGKSYDKHKGDIESLMANITRKDLLAFAESGKCASFRKFWDELVTTNF